MALRSAWWMRLGSTNPSPVGPSSTAPSLPHLSWPWNRDRGSLNREELDARLRKDTGTSCSVDKYHFKPGYESSKWEFYGSARTVAELLNFLKDNESQYADSVLYVTRQLCGEAVQALGFYLDLTPRFFSFGNAMLATGHAVDKYDFFSVQLMEKYPLKHILCGHVLYEPGCSSESPTARFRASGGDFRMHEWRVTRISLMLFKSQDGPTVHGLIYLDSSDSAFADGIQVLLTRGDELPPTDAEEADGLGKIYSTVIYIITYNWDVFLTEAETHLKALSKKCVDENLSSAEQLQYTRELHQLSPIWVEVRRRLLEAKNLTSELIEHPYFPQDQRTKTRKRTERYLQKHSKTLQDQLTRCSELSVQTNVLISLIFNIATVQDSRAAVEESKAANALAASIRRVTVLTFVYLPLSLAAGIFGMNVHQITGDVAHPAIWIYIVVALTLMTGTFGTWFLWSWTFSGLEKRQKWKTRFEKRGKTGATA